MTTLLNSSHTTQPSSMMLTKFQFVPSMHPGYAQIPKAEHLTPEQENIFFNDDVINLACRHNNSPVSLYPYFQQLAESAFTHRQLRVIRQLPLRELSIFLVANLPEAVADYPAIIVNAGPPNGDNVGFACRYRRDSRAFIVAASGKFQDTSFYGHTVKPIHYSNTIQEFCRVTINDFVVDSLARLSCHRLPIFEPVETVMSIFRRLLLPSEIYKLAHEFKDQNHFPLETTNHNDELLVKNYRIDIDRTPEAWDAMLDLIKSFYPSMSPTRIKGLWPKIRELKATRLFVARSLLDDEGNVVPAHTDGTILGVLCGGPHVITDQPWIHALVVVPDERRRGIASELLRVFFSHTCYDKVGAKLLFKGDFQPYEAAAFIKHLGGSVVKQESTGLQFEIPTTKIKNYKK